MFEGPRTMDLANILFVIFKQATQVSVLPLEQVVSSAKLSVGSSCFSSIPLAEEEKKTQIRRKVRYHGRQTQYKFISVNNGRESYKITTFFLLKKLLLSWLAF